MLKVVYRFYDKNLFEQDLAKCLDKATNNYCKESIITFIYSNDSRIHSEDH